MGAFKYKQIDFDHKKLLGEYINGLFQSTFLTKSPRGPFINYPNNFLRSKSIFSSRKPKYILFLG